MNKIINELIDNLENETPEDKKQMKRAIKKTIFNLWIDEKYIGKIDKNKAFELLGGELFVSGIERSAFHWTAVRNKDNITILFDSSELFKENK